MPTVWPSCCWRPSWPWGRCFPSSAGVGRAFPRTPARKSAASRRPASIPAPTKLSLVGPLDLNTADAAALQALPGVGPTLAERIVADRDAHGPFRAPEDLLRVPGIGPKRWERIRPLVRAPEGP